MKYIKTYENNYKERKFWLLPSDPDRYNKAILKLPENITRIDNVSIEKYNEDHDYNYIYVGCSFVDNDTIWHFSPYIVTENDEFKFGDEAFIKFGYKFAGYIDLTPEEIEQTKLDKIIDKYNL